MERDGWDIDQGAELKREERIDVEGRRNVV
jgi:hypothetical protein